jgi:hypothetical protein
MVRFRAPIEFGKRISASLLIALVLLLSFAGASPALHKSIHSDAGAPEHQCAIKLFSHGQVDAADSAPIAVVVAPQVGGVALLSETFTLSSADYRFSSSRAPPFVGLLHS